MFLNDKEKFTSIVKSICQFAFVVAVSLLLASCGIKKIVPTTHLNNKKSTDSKIIFPSKKASDKWDKPKRQSRGRAVVGKPYKIKGKWYYPQDDPTYKRIGQASWYGSDFHGRLTANGEIYDMNLLTAAHPTMPLPSYARVTNLENGSSLIVRVNDRGPFMKDRIIDLSKRAATILGYANAGVTNVKVEYIAKAPVDYYDSAYLMASYTLKDNISSSLVLTALPKEKEDIMLKGFDADGQKRSAEVIAERKQLGKTILIKLPEVGPVLVDKPMPFDQVAFMNKLNKKMKIN
ncbi:septal ring lytic transglycosylase RlpA family protein [Bartonella sp. cb54]|uniref:septal ring lytic transglycosylase RlpA family protein n=1 Tax=Bartonella sp. cb54 TaxID=3385560 RepID=UPI0039A7080D